MMNNTKTQGAQSGVKSELAGLNRDATLRGGVRSAFASTVRGASNITNGASSISQATKNVLLNARVETFEVAMERLGLTNSNLPLIHNQIVLQVYLLFFLSLVATTLGVVYMVNGSNLSAGMLASVIAVSCVVFFSQNSLQAFQIRKKKLNLLSEWLASPAQWLPSRMDGLESMMRSDPLRAPEIIAGLVKSARKKLFSAALLLGIGIGIELGVEANLAQEWPKLFYMLGGALTLTGANVSFEVFKRRMGVYCDVALWILTPTAWIPGRD